MKQKYLVIFLSLVLALTGVICQVNGQLIPEQTERSDQNVLVLPFGWDSSPSAELLAPRVSWMVKRHLRAGRFNLPETDSIESDPMEMIWKNRRLLKDVLQDTGIHWVIGGDVINVSQDAAGEWRGPHIFGVAGIPIKADVNIKLFSVELGKDVWTESYVLKGNSPRLRVLGIGAKPFPKTPAAIDAFIHDGLLPVADALTEKINSLKTKL